MGTHPAARSGPRARRARSLTRGSARASVNGINSLTHMALSSHPLLAQIDVLRKRPPGTGLCHLVWGVIDRWRRREYQWRGR
jgi:hypothetical protein